MACPYIKPRPYKDVPDSIPIQAQHSSYKNGIAIHSVGRYRVGQVPLNHPWEPNPINSVTSIAMAIENRFTPVIALFATLVFSLSVALNCAAATHVCCANNPPGGLQSHCPETTPATSDIAAPIPTNASPQCCAMEQHVATEATRTPLPLSLLAVLPASPAIKLAHPVESITDASLNTIAYIPNQHKLYLRLQRLLN